MTTRERLRQRMKRDLRPILLGGSGEHKIYKIVLGGWPLRVEAATPIKAIDKLATEIEDVATKLHEFDKSYRRWRLGDRP